MRRLVLPSSLLVLHACGPAGHAAVLEAPRAVDALPERCDDGERARPLVIDWRSNDRADFSEVVRQGVVAVRYDCDTLEVLADCHLPGRYAYVGVTPEQTEVHLRSKREVQVNLPFSGARIAAGMGDDAELHLSLVTAGKHVAQLDAGEDPEGACARASHYVRGIYRGAFELGAGASSQVGGSLAVQAVGAGGDAQASRASLVRSGDLMRCASATANATSPPAGCDIPLQLELRRLAERAPDSLSRELADATDAIGCPDGFVEVDGRCHERSRSHAYACTPSDLAECVAQCEQGNFVSCAREAYLLLNAEKPIEPDLPRAYALYQRACDAGVQHGCAGLGFFLKEGLAGAPVDVARAFELERAACEAGEARGCNMLGTMFEKGIFVAVDAEQALRLYKRACESGLAVACANEGDLHAAGSVVGANDAHAVDRLHRACLQGSGTGCEHLANLVIARRASGVAVESAIHAHVVECDHGFAAACSRLAAMLSVTGREAEAHQRRSQACALAPETCAVAPQRP